jgi:hypothetical protein
VTRGANGWHPHLHVLFLARDFPDDYLDEADELSEAWADEVTKRMGGKHTPSSAHGLDLRPCDVATYLTKLGLELADPRAIKGRAPMALLEVGEIGLYLELQLSRTRARDLTWSRGLKEIRESMPATEPPAELTSLSGTEWGRLLHASPIAPLDVQEKARDPETAQRALEFWLAGIGARRTHETPALQLAPLVPSEADRLWAARLTPLLEAAPMFDAAE